MNPEPKEEIRSRLNIEDVVGEYVELRRAGRNLKALSPFSSEKTPSFIVSPEKQIWHDFSSNRGGDLFSFVMEIEGVDFRGAMDILAQKAGVDLSLYRNDKAKELYKKKQRLYEAVELATKFYQFALSKSPTALDYWRQKRGFSDNIVTEFRLGYAPKDGRSLAKFLMDRGFTTQELKAAGLITQRRNGPGDMFRERVTVPLCDGQGRVVGFTARLLGEGKSIPKYINTSQTLLYDKSRQLFGLHLAKDAIRSADFAVIVEGNLDVIASHQVGEKAVVASAGTALTRDHLAQLARLTPHIKLAFDGDKAGLLATERAISIASEIGIELSIIVMPEGVKDPDELIQQDPLLWKKVVQQSMYALDWVILQYEKRCNLESAEGKRTFTTKTLEVVKQLSDPVEQDHYIQLLAKRISASPQALQQKMQGIEEKTPRKLLHQIKPPQYTPDNFAYQDDFLAIIVRYPKARDILQHIDPQDLVGEQRQQIASFLQQSSDAKLDNSLPNSLQHLETYVKILLLRAAERHSHYTDIEAFDIAKETATKIKKEKQKSVKQQLIRQLAAAEKEENIEQIHAIRQQLDILIKEQRNE